MGRIIRDTILLIDDEEVISKTFELSSTIKEFFQGLVSLFETGHDNKTYFCCTCGDHGCAFIRWDLILQKGNIFINMENLLGEPIGKHLYRIEKFKFLSGILSLFDTVINFMDANNIDELDRGNLNDFKWMREEIKSYCL